METYIVDSFTDEAFTGNPAGVCIAKDGLADHTMQSIAIELGLSETAFITKIDDQPTYSIRYFSPKMEIPLCGHATLAASKIVFDTTRHNRVRFINCQELNLDTRLQGNEILMEFPVYGTSSYEVPQALMDALGLEYVCNVEYNKETNIALIEIDSSIALRQLNPDFTALQQSINTINGVLITAPDEEGTFDFHSRYFWPWSGTNEDPVTGGTHTFLAPYWSKRLNKKKMKSFQSSRRSGFMEVELIEQNKLIIRSQAVIIFEGRLKI